MVGSGKADFSGMAMRWLLGPMTNRAYCTCSGTVEHGHFDDLCPRKRGGKVDQRVGDPVRRLRRLDPAYDTFFTN